MANHFGISVLEAKYILGMLLPIRCIKDDFNLQKFNTLCGTYLYSFQHLALIFGKPVDILQQIALEQGFDVKVINDIDKDVDINKKPDVVIGRLNKHLLAEQVDVVKCIALIKCYGYTLQDVANEFKIDIKDLKRYLGHSAIYHMYMDEDSNAPKVKIKVIKRH